MSENYQNWVERIVGGRDSKPLSSGDIVKSSEGQPFGAIEFIRINKLNFYAEVGKKGNYYIFHFFPIDSWIGSTASFREEMVKAFNQVFKDHGEIEIDWVEDMLSFAVRVSGWTSHVWGDELAVRAIDVTEDNLYAREAKYAPQSVPK